MLLQVNCTEFKSRDFGSRH